MFTNFSLDSLVLPVVLFHAEVDFMPDSIPRQIITTIKFPPEMLEAIRARASADHVTPSEVIKRALDLYLGFESKRRIFSTKKQQTDV